jgi:hypothetical protein
MKVYKGILLFMTMKKVGNLFMLEGRMPDHATTISENDSDFV